MALIYGNVSNDARGRSIFDKYGEPNLLFSLLFRVEDRISNYFADKTNDKIEWFHLFFSLRVKADIY